MSKNTRFKAGIGLLAILAAAVVIFSGCNLWKSVAEKAIEKSTNSNVDISGNGNSITITSGNSTVSYGETELPKNFPTDIPVYAGAKAVGSVSVSGEGENVFVTLTSTASKDTVAAWYKTELVSKGWEITNTLETATGNAKVTSYSVKKGNKSGNISVSEGTDEYAGKTVITIVI